MQKVQNLGNERRQIYKKPCQESGLCRVHMRDIRKKVLPKFIKLCMETPCLFQWHKYGRRKRTETSVFEFSYLCVNSSLEEPIKIKVIFILRQEMFRQQNLQKSEMFLTPIRAFLASHAGVFGGARISFLPTNACSTEDNIPFPLSHSRGK